MYIWHLNQILMHLWTRIKISSRFQCITQSERRMVCVNAYMYECVYTATKEIKHILLYTSHRDSTLKNIVSHFTTMITIPTTTVTKFKSRYFSLKWCQSIPTREGNEHLIPGKYTVNKKMILYFVHSLHRVPLVEWASNGNIITATTKNRVQQQPTK